MENNVVIQPLGGSGPLIINQTASTGAVQIQATSIPSSPIITVDTAVVKIVIDQPVLSDQLSAFPVMKGEKGDSALETYRIETNNPLATREQYEAYLMISINNAVAAKLTEVDAIINEGAVMPVIEARPSTGTWWINGVDSHQSYSNSLLTTYVYEQNMPSSIWVIDHLMNKLPSVTLLDTSGKEVIGEVDYPSNTKVVVTFTYPLSGKAILN